MQQQTETDPCGVVFCGLGIGIVEDKQEGVTPNRKRPIEERRKAVRELIETWRLEERMAS